MKRFSIVLVVLAGLAWAGNAIVVTNAVGQAGTLQNTKTAGIPVVHQNGTNLQAVTLTASSADDAGLGDEPTNCTFFAYKYTPQNVAVDGGVGNAWGRFPQLDVIVADAGSYALSNGGGITVVIPATTNSYLQPATGVLLPMGNGDRLQWITSNCMNPDAGVMNPQLLTEGYYK